MSVFLSDARESERTSPRKRGEYAKRKQRKRAAVDRSIDCQLLFGKKKQSKKKLNPDLLKTKKLSPPSRQQKALISVSDKTGIVDFAKVR